ncbi:YybH family protein [Micromonospora sp. NPDC050417]|uniref:YybH family protein n=1 Tax=Micromonospora sp. NPDC050417 TaxID=3364280 RepID=UPI0037B772FA
MDREQVAAWVAAYERAWRTAGTETLATIFTEDASYQQGPYLEPVHGLAALARMWEAQREGPDEVFGMLSQVVAIDGDTVVIRTEVRYGLPVTEQFRDLWILRFADDGRCRAFEEWPFWPPGQHSALPDRD